MPPIFAIAKENDFEQFADENEDGKPQDIFDLMSKLRVADNDTLIKQDNQRSKKKYEYITFKLESKEKLGSLLNKIYNFLSQVGTLQIITAFLSK